MQTSSDGQATRIATLAELLKNRARQDPLALAFQWLVNGEREGCSLTYGTLNARATAIAVALQALNLQRKIALLSYTPGLEFIEALFGCFYAGVIAVPAYVPGSMRERPRIEGILRDAGCDVILTTASSLNAVTDFVRDSGSGASCVATDLVERNGGNGETLAVSGNTIAYLQYTSGSTSAPKGVIVSHSNVLANLRYIAANGAFGPDSMSVSWLPHFHDMGLIYGILQPLYSRFPAVLLSPSSFIHRPLRWLTAISRYRGTHCGGPNFAYDLCVERIGAEALSALELSSWQVAFNGAEPVRVETLERFASHFAGCGFQSNAFYPVYGLAEASLKVSSGNPGVGPKSCVIDGEEMKRHRAKVLNASGRSGYVVVSCGRACAPHEIAIVNPRTRKRRPEGEIGEIWVTGPSVAMGYWENAAETHKIFKAGLEGSEKHFLRTGDLGFMHGGELFITGRLKDCIIIHGRNHYPQDIENTVLGCGLGLRANGTVAFAVETQGQEEVVIVSEMAGKYRGDSGWLCQTIRQAVTEAHDVKVHAVVLIKSGSLPRTSSGKIQRSRCKSLFLANQLAVLWKSEFDTPLLPGGNDIPTRETMLGEVGAARQKLLETYIRSAVSAIGRSSPEDVGGHHTLAALGFDSLKVFELKQRIEDELSVAIPVIELLHLPISRIGEWIGDHFEVDGRATQAPLQGSPREPATVFPLSWAQEQVWLMQNLVQESCAYNQLLVLRLTGDLDAYALQEAMAEVVRRHEILRAVVIDEEGIPGQRLGPVYSFDLPPLQIGSAGDPESALLTVIDEMVNRPFRAGAEQPLLRFVLVGLTDQSYMLVLVAHHLVCDGASTGVLVRELSALYAAYAKSEQSPLPALPLQYRDLVAWERSPVFHAAFEEQLGYWCDQLTGVPVLDLPTDYPRPAVMSGRGGSVALEMSAAQTKDLIDAARREGVTLFMDVLAAFQWMLSQYSRQQDIAVGTAVDNRSLSGTEHLIGLFVNTIVLRTRWDGEVTIRGLLGKVRQVTAEAYERRHVPFVKVVEQMRPERELSRTPLFQVMLVFQPEFIREVDLDLVSIHCTEMQTGTVKCDLVLRVVETSPRLRAYLDYNLDIFSASTVQRMVAHLQTLLQAIVAAPEADVSSISALPESERKQVLVEWNQTLRPYCKVDLVHKLFEQQARRTPSAVAAVHRSEKLTYAELSRRTNQMANHLRRLGVGPEVPVGICLTRTMNMLAAVLGVLKAGGAFVRLEPKLPVERLSYMIQDMKLRVILTEQSLMGMLPQSGVTLVALDGWPEMLGRESDKDPATVTVPGNAAYVIYTSGSTGTPKGVVIQHGSLLNYMLWVRESLLGDGIECLPAITSLRFDACLKQLLGPLLVGGKVFLVGDLLQDSGSIVELLSSHSRSALNCVPSVWQQVLAEIPQNQLPVSINLAHLMLGGESASPELIRRSLQAIPNLRISNLYGPTEATANATYAGNISPENMSIGRPIANTQVYVLDAVMLTVGIGMVGELHIGGEGVARGYQNQPALTAERFVPDPFSGQEGARLYRTGDLVRWREDGNLELKGRADFQVKIRGYRIELGEIESRLLASPLVREAMVMAVENGSAGRQLVAYVVPASGAMPVYSDLQSHLKTRLPDYMVPSAFVILDELPRLANGKIDRKSLPAPAAISEEQRGLRTQQQEVLCGIFAEVLGLERVGLEDNFFAAGGNSLLAMRLVGRMRKIFGVEIEIRAIFEKPTVLELATLLGEGSTAGIHLTRRPRPERPPLSYAQQGLWFIDQLQGRGTDYILSQALSLKGALDPVLLEKTVNVIVERHESLRTCFAEESGKPFQVILPKVHIPLPVDDLTDEDDASRIAELNRLASEESRIPFDLKHGPLLRTRLLHLGENDHMLLFSIHHIVSDGWSIQVMMDEITRLYAAGAIQERSGLPVLEIQYADFALFEREWLEGEWLEQQLNYWTDQLAGSPTLALRTDRPRPKIKNYRGSAIDFDIEEALTGSLERSGRSEGATLFMTVLATFQMLLSKYAGQQDVAVGAVIANRNHIETERLIGLLVNTLVLRSNVEGGTIWKNFLAQVRQTTLEAYRNQDLPFEMLVEKLQPPRALDRTPLFQAILAFQNFPQSRLEIAGLRISPLADEHPPVKSDLDLHLWLGRGSMHGRLIFDRELFDQITIEGMVTTFRQLLQEIVKRPDAELDDLLFPATPALPQIVAGGGGGRLPTSYHQERLWLLDRFESGAVNASLPTCHNMVLAIRLQGGVNQAVLQESLAALTQRHELLRTRMAEENGQVFQWIAEVGDVWLQTPTDGAAELLLQTEVEQRWIMKIAGEPFVLKGSPLMRAWLLSDRSNESLLLLGLHHMIADRWSLRQIAADLAEIYSSAVEGRVAQLPRLGISYTRFGCWQRDLRDQEWAPFRQYWKRELSGEFVNLELPLKCPRHTADGYHAAIERFSIPLAPDCTAKQVEAPAFLLAGFYALLYLYSGQQEFFVGIQVPGRQAAGAENAVGPFANLLPIKGRPRGRKFNEFAKSMAKSLTLARRHAAMPFELLLSELKMPDEMRRETPLDVLFNYEEEASTGLRFGHLATGVVENNLGLGRYDLNLLVRETCQGWAADLVYNSKLYDASTIHQMARQWQTLLVALAGDGDVVIDGIDLLSEAERRQQLEEWNSTAAGYPEKTLHGLFEEQVLANPDRIAVYFESRHLSYSALNERANRLAHFLRKQGVRSESMVAICVERSIEMIVAILGILKAGGAYLPLDTYYPPERLKLLLSDSGGAHLVTTETLAPKFEEQIGSLILLDRDKEAIDAQPAVNPGDCAGPRNLAYCIYTSGSTGSPNGVLIEHWNVVRLMKNSRFYFDFGTEDVWTLFHSCSFDFSVWEMWGALLYGGRLVLVDRETAQDPRLFVELLRQQRVTVLNQTPGAFYAVQDESLRHDDLALQLKYVIFSGETLQPAHLKSWKNRYRNIKLINMLGPTETTVVATCREIDATDIEQGRSCIGVSMPTVKVYILNERMDLLPVGARGEIYIGGAGLARGYLSRSILTAQRFVPDPFSDDPGRRLYRTGDAARYLPDGNMVYMGRLDQQVKIRGFRIEPGEIEVALKDQEGVAHAAVVVREDTGRGRELVAYLVPAHGAAVDAAQLRQRLSERLPSYMIPAAFVFMDKLVLTNNGKLDRKALPLPRQTKEDYAPPRTQLEEMVCVIFEEVLAAPHVGIYDNFFDLGGHSLLATQVVSRLRKELSVEVPLHMLFEEPTVAGLVDRIIQYRDCQPF